MFIPPRALQQQMRAAQQQEQAAVSLRTSHLVIPTAIADRIFGSTFNVHLVYYPQKRSLLIAGAENELFRQLHKSKQHLLKAGDAQGNRTIALHELLIDNGIPAEDRTLAYEAEDALGVLNVSL
ncbi:hypothetical protein [Phaeodactylibacter sp.]|uniref:hypothetical protein n=1 Tax=Phaeodactylibacter sp. TaxID=1940289 RepID=UPI0025D51D7C|nr:hypothetical protein [Phaeodactylibacter sp.]MCI4648935.1 hypothetical protein [Phaeodactylibacter sp.]MCI5091814.1 hypothetical protein [Phaeodactylibacter sp.]